MTTRESSNSLLEPHADVASMPTGTSSAWSRSPEGFLKGPIPRAWLACAMPLPGKALHVALQIWRDVDLATSNVVAISLSGMEDKIGGSRFAARRGLAALEKASLVSVIRHVGRNPVVTVLAFPSEPKTEAL